MQDLNTIVKTRRSAMKFIQGIEIPASDWEEMFTLNQSAPSAFNLQHAEYIVITDEEQKNAMYEAAYKQYKIKTASAVIIVIGNTKAYQNVGRLNEGMLHLGMMSKQEYDATVDSVTSMYESRGEVFQRDEAVRNASLSAMQFMLIAKEKGWDTCPMIGFDSEAVSQVLGLTEEQLPVLMITIGKSDTSSERPRGYRKPVREYVTFR